MSEVPVLSITDMLAEGIENWSTDRNQRVTLKETESRLLHMHSGVPQGSVRGPLLFVI